MTNPTGIPIWSNLPATIKSVLLHVGVLACFTLKTFFFPSEPIQLESAIRVDVIDLPDKIIDPIPPTRAEPKKEASKPVEKPAPKPKEHKVAIKKEAPDKSKVSTKEAIKRARALEKIEEMLAAEKSASKKQEFKGNIISKGSQLTGIAKLQYDDYLDRLDAHVRSFWSIPTWLSGRDFRARALVRLSPEGLIQSREIILSSGNSSYDDYVLTTIDKASPFPPPTEKFVDILGQEGFVLGFPD